MIPRPCFRLSLSQRSYSRCVSPHLWKSAFDSYQRLPNPLYSLTDGSKPFQGSSHFRCSFSKSIYRRRPENSEAVATTPKPSVYTPPQKGVLSLLPSRMVPYAELMRLDKPTGLYLFYFPYLFGVLYGACVVDPPTSVEPLLRTCATLLVGTIIMRGAACTWNDNIDRDLDRQVARCRLRPIARGAVSPLQGHAFTLAQSFVGIALLAQLPMQCAYYAVPVIVLLGLYPFAKRITNYPQVILGFPVAWGMFLASTAVGVDPFAIFFLVNSPSPVDHLVLASMACFYMSNIAWTVIYDTIYAFQDVEDDAKADIKSIAVRHRANTKTLLSSLAVAQVSLLAATGLLTGMSPLYYLGSCGGTAMSLAIMIRKVDLKRPESCAWWFRMGTWFVGLAVVSGLCGEYSMRLRKPSTSTSVEA